ncbi:non-ribosomal peptide synthetase, partial [Streptomyces sp. NPDC090442]
MSKSMDDDREYWRQVLTAGGCTAIPRWAPEPQPGIAVHEQPFPEDLVRRLDRWTAAVEVPLNAVLLAAHAKVLAALSGDQEVTTGYLAGDGGPALPCRVSTAPETWYGLVQESARARAELLSHANYPVPALSAELGLGTALFETELELSGNGGDLAESTVLRVVVVRRGERMVLRLRYRSEVLDAESVVRVGGYHVAALVQLVADPGAVPVQGALLSVAERGVQLEGLAGPCREVPDRRFHELFEERVRVEPGAVAVVWGEGWLSYGELNGWANRLGRALVAEGLGREGVVG